MKNIICLCNTYTQLIIAIQLKATIKKNSHMLVVLSDKSRNAEVACENIRKTGFFDDVIFFPSSTLDLGHRNFRKALVETFDEVRGNINIHNDYLENIRFDEFIYFNLNVSAGLLFSYLYKKNKDIICSIFEEGILSYPNVEKEAYADHLPKRMKLCFSIRKLLNKRNVCDSIAYFYCYYPGFYYGKETPIQVPFITDKTCKEILSKAFNIDNSFLHYPQKYIFLASMGDFEGEEPIGEVKIAIQIAALVGKENLLVKTHPRDKTNAFEKAGLLVDSFSTAPWEIIQLNYDFSNHVFLTVASNSVFGVNMMMEKRPRSYFLYRFCNISRNQSVRNTVNIIEQLFKSADRLNLSNYFIVDRLEDIMEDGANE